MGDMQCGRCYPDMWLKWVAPRSDAMELGWIKGVSKGWRIKQEWEFSPGA